MNVTASPAATSTNASAAWENIASPWFIEFDNSSICIDPSLTTTPAEHPNRSTVEPSRPPVLRSAPNLGVPIVLAWLPADACCSGRILGGVELDPEDLRIDLIRQAPGPSCAVRVTHLPTGQSVTVDDAPDSGIAREIALRRLSELLS